MPEEAHDPHPPHGHAHGGHDLATASYMRVVAVVIAIATIIRLVVLWPRGDAPDLAASTSGIDLVDATITAIGTVACTDPVEGAPTQCRLVSVDVTSGSPTGQAGTFLSSVIDFSQPEFEVGEKVVLSYNELAPPEFQFSFAEYQRRAPLVLLALVLAAVVVGFGKWKGVRALAGLTVSLGVLSVPSALRATQGPRPPVSRQGGAWRCPS